LRANRTNGNPQTTNGSKTGSLTGVAGENRGMPANPIQSPLRVRGFTIIELMIVVVVLALLAAVALPSFLDSLRKSKRTEAFNALTTVQQAQERWRTNEPAYANNLTAAPTADPPGLGLSGTTAGGLYTIALTGVSSTGYTVTAVAVEGKSQASDARCKRMAVRINGAQISYAGCESCEFEVADFAPTNACWSR
jgi:type IV pilus assembly protein PilE